MLLNLGAYMTPHVAYMHTIGLETLDARYRIQSANAAMLAGKLRILSAVKRVNYVGLKDNSYYALAQSKEACFAFINRLKLIRRATNLFDNKTLAIHPASTIFGPFTDKQRQDMDVLDTTIRFSIGLEDVDDLFDDVRQALNNKKD